MKKLLLTVLSGVVVLSAALFAQSTSYNWDMTTPPGNEALSNGAFRIREFKSAYFEQFGVDHALPLSESTLGETTGYEKELHFIDSVATDTNAFGGILRSKKDTYGKSHPWWIDQFNDKTQLDTQTNLLTQPNTWTEENTFQETTVLSGETTVETPVKPMDAANKAYVDDATSSLNNTVTGHLLYLTEITSSETYTVPAGVTQVFITGCGGGGGGGSSGGGGGSAAGGINIPVTVTGGNSYYVTIGSGGTATYGNDGTAGGTTSFANLSFGGGGGGGPSGTGGIAGSISYYVYTNSYTTTPSGGFVGRAGDSYNVGGSGAGSLFGPGVPTSRNISGNNLSATSPGAGGGGSEIYGHTGGAGAPGFLIIEYVK